MRFLSMGPAFLFASFALSLGVSSGPSGARFGGGLSDSLRGRSPSEQVRYLCSLKESGVEKAAVDFHLGNAMYALGQMDSAAYYYREAIAKDSTYSKAYVNLGIVLDSKRKYLEAEALYKRALEVNQRDALAHCHLGHLYYKRGECNQAIEHYLGALEIDPRNAQAHYNLGLAFADAHVFGEALREWELVVKFAPDSELGRTASENIGLIRKYLRVKIPK